MASRRASSSNEENENQLREINETVKSLRDELQNMKSELTAVRAENNLLKQALNLTNYRLDSLEQYGIFKFTMFQSLQPMKMMAKLKLLRSRMISIFA